MTEFQQEHLPKLEDKIRQVFSLASTAMPSFKERFQVLTQEQVIQKFTEFFNNMLSGFLPNQYMGTRFVASRIGKLHGQNLWITTVSEIDFFFRLLGEVFTRDLNPNDTMVMKASLMMVKATFQEGWHTAIKPS